MNVSVCRAGNYEKFKATGDFGYLGTRCEIKNVNSDPLHRLRLIHV